MFNKIKTFESFKVPAYRIYYGSMVGNWFAQSMAMMVRSLLILRLTDSAMAIGLMSLALAIPSLLISLLGGALADRFPKKFILIGSRGGLALISLGVAFALYTGFLSSENPGSWMLLIAAAALEGVINGFLMPVNMAIIPEIVDHGRVMNAISLSMMGQNVFRLASPILAGWIIDAFGFADIYFTMTGMYFLATAILIFLPLTGRQTYRGSGAIGDIVNGFRYIKREKIIMVVVIFTVCHVISGQPFNQLLPVFTEKILNVSATKLGTLLAVSSIGSLISSISMASLPNKKRGLLLLLSGVIMGGALVVFSFSRWWSLSLGLMPLVAMGQTLHGTLTSTIIQTNVSPDYRGRMQSFNTMSSGLSSLGTFFAGALSGAIGIQWSIAGLAIFLIVVSAFLIIKVPELRKLD